MFDLETLQNLPILTLPGTDISQLTGLSNSQSWINSHYYFIEYCWWVVFFSTLFYMVFYLFSYKNVEKEEIKEINIVSTNKFVSFYRKIFSLEEIEKSDTLRLLGGALLIGYILTFYGFVEDISPTVEGVKNGLNLCWPFFQNCESIIFLKGYPYSYMQQMVYALLFGIILLSARKLLERKILIAHAGILILFIWLIYTILTSYHQHSYAANYTYYIVGLSFIFLFASYKNFFACLSFILFYFLSTTTKINDTWILGSYFSALKLGAPFFSNELIPFATNFVIFIEIIGAWFLMSSNKLLQRTMFYCFTAFHLYAVIIILYYYSIIAIPIFMILFGPLFKPFKSIPKNRKSYIGWAFIISLFIFQAIPHMISGDRRMTMEAHFFGFFMFEANHQCDSRVIQNNSVIHRTTNSISDYRCDVYKVLKQSQFVYCKQKNDPNKYRLEFLHSINGGPFYQIVAEDDLCSLTYKPFSKNDWIKTKETAPALFRPNKN